MGAKVDCRTGAGEDDLFPLLRSYNSLQTDRQGHKANLRHGKWGITLQGNMEIPLSIFFGRPERGHMRRKKMTQERVDAYLRREAWLNELDRNNKAKARKQRKSKTRAARGQVATEEK